MVFDHKFLTLCINYPLCIPRLNPPNNKELQVYIHGDWTLYLAEKITHLIDAVSVEKCNVYVNLEFTVSTCKQYPITLRPVCH